MLQAPIRIGANLLGGIEWSRRSHPRGSAAASQN